MKRYPFSRKNATYTVAIFKDQRPASHTAAFFKPYENEIDYNLPKPVYRPLLGPGQFTLVDQDDDTHEGEVIAGDEEPGNSNQLDQVQDEYHTIDENDPLASFENSVHENTDDSYFPEESHPDSASSNFTGYAESYYPHNMAVSDSIYNPWYIMPIAGSDMVLEDTSNSTAVKLKNANANSGTHYYIGYKIWYSAVVFVIYQTIVALVYHLTLLARHYLQFPSAFHAAAAASYQNS